MKYYLFFVVLLLGLLRCTKEVPTAFICISGANDSILRAGDQVILRWGPSGGTLPMMIILENSRVAGVLHECLLIPEHQYGGHAITKDDGEDQYYLPWRYGDEGRELYGDTIGTQTFTLRVVLAQYDTVVGVWREGVVRARSSHTFIIHRSRYPDGCRGPFGASVTTGQDCY